MSITRDDYVSVLEEFYGDWPGMERVLSACADSLVALHGEENPTPDDERRERDALVSARDLWRGRAMDKSAENARLREDLETYRLSLDAANVHGAKLDDEISRLRAELGEWKTKAEVVRNSGDSGRRDAMTDERREHFAAKMFGPAAPHHMTPESWEVVDAAMAVADAERSEEMAVWAKAAHKLLAENERLRIELADAELAQTTRLREELRTEEQTSYALRKDIERLRAALGGE